jgi:rod shape-determining protein MreD
MSTILPALSVLFAVLATAVPWGLPADASFTLPLVVVMMVFCWRIMPDAALPLTACMLLGLLTDVMSGGPLGFFALMALIAASIGGFLRFTLEPRDLWPLWLVWSALALTLGLLAWLLGSLYFFRWVDWWPILFSTLTSIALFPVVLRGLVWIKRGRLGPDHSAMFRGWS